MPSACSTSQWRQRIGRRSRISCGRCFVRSWKGWVSRPSRARFPRSPADREVFISVLGTIGQDEDVGVRCHELFEAARAEHGRLPADTGEAILQVVAWRAGRDEFDAMHERVARPIDPLDQWRHMVAITSVRQPELIGELQEMTVTEIRTQDAPYMIRRLLGSRAGGELTWHFVTSHWGELTERFAPHAIPSMLGGISRLADIDDDGNPVLADQVRGFLAEHPLGGLQKPVDQHLERLAVNIGFVARAPPDARRAALEGLRALGRRTGHPVTVCAFCAVIVSICQGFLCECPCEPH